VVINLVGRTYNTRNYTIDQANVDTARVVAEVSANAGVDRLIHFSAVGASPDSPSEFLRAKHKSEEVVREIYPSATIMRPTQVFGPEDRFINKFGFILSFTHKWLPLLVNPDAYVQPISARDVATAVMNALNDPNTMGKTFELGGPDVLTLREMIEDILFFHAKAGKGKIVTIPRALGGQFWSQFWAKFLGTVQRVPLYNADEVNYYLTDNIVQPGSLMCKDLGIDQRISLDDVAVNLLRHYRNPSEYFDLDHANALRDLQQSHFHDLEKQAPALHKSE
jgi:NADH dehydrogenase (ubiquinone) 1 alpha subcomplex subunit 9